MNRKNIKLLVFLLSMCLAVSLTACGNPDFSDYSRGIDENGFYEDFTPVEIDKEKNTIAIDKVMEYAARQEGLDSVDELVNVNANNMLIQYLPDQKENVEDSDVVTLSMKFEINGEIVEQYEEIQLKANKDGDDIAKSLIGKKKNDTYTFEYTYPTDAPEHPSEKANVEINIMYVAYGDPMSHDFINNHLEDIQKQFPDTTSYDSFMQNIKVGLTMAYGSLYLEDQMKNADIKIDDKYAENEMYRLQARLYMMDVKWGDYLKQLDRTETEAKEVCMQTAKEYYILMSVAQNNISVTEEDLKEHYGEKLNDMITMLGEPYLKMSVLKEKTLNYIIDNITFD